MAPQASGLLLTDPGRAIRKAQIAWPSVVEAEDSATGRLQKILFEIEKQRGNGQWSLDQLERIARGLPGR